MMTGAKESRAAFPAVAIPTVLGGDRANSAVIGQTHHLTQLDLARRWAVSARTLERWRWLRTGPRI